MGHFSKKSTPTFWMYTSLHNVVVLGEKGGYDVNSPKSQKWREHFLPYYPPQCQGKSQHTTTEKVKQFDDKNNISEQREDILFRLKNNRF